MRPTFELTRDEPRRALTLSLPRPLIEHPLDVFFDFSGKSERYSWDGARRVFSARFPVLFKFGRSVEIPFASLCGVRLEIGAGAKELPLVFHFRYRDKRGE